MPDEAEPGPNDRETAYALLQRGQALMRDRHNAQAAVLFQRAARLEPGKASILEALGRACYNSGQHQRSGEARTHLRLAAALDPASATYRRALDRAEARREPGSR
jgi:Flp pilus assembly protein TadD